jgi:hypothetical protein
MLSCLLLRYWLGDDALEGQSYRLSLVVKNIIADPESSVTGLVASC